jgi:hypothetical protein
MGLEPATRTPSPWYLRLAGATVALVFATAALIAGFWTQFGGAREITQPTDLRIVLPLASAALIAAIVSLARGERPRGLAIGALGMAAAAPLLGWVVLVGAVAAATLVVAVIIAKFQ